MPLPCEKLASRYLLDDLFEEITHKLQRNLFCFHSSKHGYETCTFSNLFVVTCVWLCVCFCVCVCVCVLTCAFVYVFVCMRVCVCVCVCVSVYVCMQCSVIVRILCRSYLYICKFHMSVYLFISIFPWMTLFDTTICVVECVSCLSFGRDCVLLKTQSYWRKTVALSNQSAGCPDASECVCNEWTYNNSAILIKSTSF